MNSVEEDKYIGLHKENSAAEDSERLYLFFNVESLQCFIALK